MTAINADMRAALREQGYVVVPDVLTQSQIATWRGVIADLLAQQPYAAGHAGPYFLWPRFGPDGHRLLDLYREAGIADLAGQLLRPELAIEDPEFAQVATTIPPWRHIPGGPHVDGLTPVEADGRPATFSMLAGIWLTDQHQRDRGNLWVWPGTHLRFGRYLADHGADALTRIEEMNVGPYPKVDLGEPTQATGAAGSVLFAHYLLAHNIGGHEGTADDDRRETVYYRVSANGHRDRWREVVTDPLVELRT